MFTTIWARRAEAPVASRTPLFGTGLLGAGLFFYGLAFSAHAEVPPAIDPRIYTLVDEVSAHRIEADIRQLVGFGTRHTLSETESETRGIGAARRWIEAEMQRISAACDDCLEIVVQRFIEPGDERSRIREDTEIVNVLGHSPRNGSP